MLNAAPVTIAGQQLLRELAADYQAAHGHHASADTIRRGEWPASSYSPPLYAAVPVLVILHYPQRPETPERHAMASRVLQGFDDETTLALIRELVEALFDVAPEARRRVGYVLLADGTPPDAAAELEELLQPA